MIGLDNEYLLYWYKKKHEHLNIIDITWMQITIQMKLKYMDETQFIEIYHINTIVNEYM